MQLFVSMTIGVSHAGQDEGKERTQTSEKGGRSTPESQLFFFFFKNNDVIITIQSEYCVCVCDCMRAIWLDRWLEEWREDMVQLEKSGEKQVWRAKRGRGVVGWMGRRARRRRRSAKEWSRQEDDERE